MTDDAACAAIRAAVITYPRHVAGRIVQQGGLSLLHGAEHKWRLPPHTVCTLLAAAEAWWRQESISYI